MFAVALFIIAKIWKQPKCPLTDEWIKKMWCVYMCIYIYIHNGILLIYKKQWNFPNCNNMDGLGEYDIVNKSSQEKQIPYDITFMWNLKI